MICASITKGPLADVWMLFKIDECEAVEREIDQYNTG